MISATFHSTSGRSDVVVYGRYNETILLLIMLVGFAFLFFGRVSRRTICIAGASLVLLSLATFLLYGSLREQIFMLFNSVALYPFVWKGSFSEWGQLVATVCALAAGIVLWFISRRKADWIKCIVIAVLCVYYTFVGYNVLYGTSIKVGHHMEHLTAITEVIRNDKENLPIYYGTSEYSGFYPSFLQFSLYEVPMKQVLLDDLPTGEEYYIACTTDDMLLIDRDFEIVEASNGVVLLRTDGRVVQGEKSISVPFHILSTSVGEIHEDGIYSTGTSGFLQSGPYFGIPAGQAQWTIELTFEGEGPEVLGRVELSARPDGTTVSLEVVEIVRDEFVDGRQTITVQSDSMEPLVNTECRVVVATGVQLGIVDVTLKYAPYHGGEE